MTLGTTVDDLINRVRRDALLGLRGPIYTLGFPHSAGATQVFLDRDPTKIGPGSVLAIDAELFYVLNVDAATKLATVVPGYLGTTEANHDLTAFVEVDSRVPKAALVDYAQQEILSWGSQLFRVDQVDLAVRHEERTYELDVDSIYFLLDSRVAPLGTEIEEGTWSWAGDAWPKVEANLMRRMPTADFTSGFAIQLTQFPRNTSTVRVAYARPFDTSTFDLDTDLVADVGLLPDWLDLLELGVRYRVLSSGLVGRTDARAAGMSRNAEEVTVTDVVRAADMARSMRDRRLADAGLELRRDWPYGRS